jgi:hypothetical protein
MVLASITLNNINRNMKSLAILILLVLLVQSNFCVGQNSKSGLDKIIDKGRLKLKNFAFCACLSRSYPKDSTLFYDGTEAGYFELSAYGFSAFNRIDSLSTIASAVHYSSKHDRPLALMKCLDFYNSQGLDSFIRKLDDELSMSRLQKRLEPK